MAYLEKARELANDPEQLELAYQEALHTGEEDAFAEALHTAYAETGDNLLFAAWHYRLLHTRCRIPAGTVMGASSSRGLELYIMIHDLS